MVAEIVHEFPGNQGSYIAGAAVLRIALGTPCVDHILREGAAVCIIVCAMAVKIFNLTLTITIFCYRLAHNRTFHHRTHKK